MATNQLFFTSYALYNAGLQLADDTTGKWYDLSVDSFDEILETLEEAQERHGLGDDVEPMATDYNFAFIPSSMYEESMDRELYEKLQKLDGLSEVEMVAFDFLLSNCGYEFEDALDKYDEVQLTTESAEDYAYEIAEELFSLKGPALQYFDGEAFARDLQMNGDIVEWGDYLVTNANDF